MEALKIISYAFAGGLLPSLFWLWFWLREDRKHPEPKRMIALAFFLGMFAVLIVIPIQEFVHSLVVSFAKSEYAFGITLTILWAFSEEFMKLLMALPALKSKFMDEPIDAVIYLITVALGFAALENSLFIYGTFLNSESVSETLILGNLRFMGASLLHVISSATVGFFIAFSFYNKNKVARKAIVFLGVILAVIIHSLYNFLLSAEHQSILLWTFSGVWVIVISIFIVFEKMKIWNKIKKLR